MAEQQLLKQIAQDVGFVKKRIITIEQEVRALSEELFEVRPEYSRDLEKIDQGKFLTRREFEKGIDNA